MDQLQAGQVRLQQGGGHGEGFRRRGSCLF
jgi:hypothetical protein